MNYKNKPSLFKRESFYIILFLVLAIVATVVAIAVRNSANDTEQANVTENSSTVASAPKQDLNLSSNLEDQGPENSLQVKNNQGQEQEVAVSGNETNSANVENESDSALEIQPQEEENVASDNDEESSDAVADENTEEDASVNTEVDTDADVDSIETDTDADANSETEPVASDLNFTFLKPVAGQVVTDFDNFIEGKSENGNQWFTFSNGIEISASVGAAVNAAGDGEVVLIEQDFNGAIVTIDHGNGIKTVYKNLDQASLLVDEGDIITQDEQIGNVGEVNDVYIEKGPRLCFEVIRNGEYQDPLKYIR